MAFIQIPSGNTTTFRFSLGFSYPGPTPYDHYQWDIAGAGSGVVAPNDYFIVFVGSFASGTRAGQNLPGFSDKNGWDGGLFAYYTTTPDGVTVLSGPQTFITVPDGITTGTYTAFWSVASPPGTPSGQGGGEAYVTFNVVPASPRADPCTCTATWPWTPPQGNVTAALTATPGTLTAGEVTTLTYGTMGAHSAAIDSGVGPVPPPSGSVPAAPTTSLTYTLDALGDWLTHVSATADVTVGAPGIDPGDPAPLDCPCDWLPAAAPACSGWVTGNGVLNFGLDAE